MKAQVIMVLAASTALAGRPAQGQIDALNACAAALREVGAGADGLLSPRTGMRDAAQRQVAAEARLLAEGARQVLFGLEKLLVIEMDGRDPGQMRWLPSARRVMVADLLDYCRRGRGSAQAWLRDAGDDRVRDLVQRTALVLDRLEGELKACRQDWDGPSGR